MRAQAIIRRGVRCGEQAGRRWRFAALLQAVRLVGIAALLVSAAAATGGCSFESEQARRALESQDAVERADGLRRLTEARDPRLADLALPLVRDSSPRVRRAAVAALGAVSAQGRCLPALVGRLADADLEVRLVAVRVLGDSQQPAARAALLPLLEDSSQIVRRAAAVALDALGLSRAMQVRALAKRKLDEEATRLASPVEEVRAAAARLLGLSGRPEAAAALLARLPQERSPRVIEELALALGVLSGGEPSRRLVRLVRSRVASDRLSAAHGLARMGSKEAMEALLTLAVDQDPGVRASAMRGLQALRPLRARRRELPEAVSRTACAALTDSDPTVREAAAKLVRARALGPICAAALGRLLRQMDQMSDADLALLAPLDVRAERALFDRARLRLAQHRAASERWVPPSRWQELEQAPRAAAAAGAGGGARESRPQRAPAPRRARGDEALRRLLSRFPEEATAADDWDDPLLPPRVSGGEVAMLARALVEHSDEARGWLSELASYGPSLLRSAALEALAGVPAERSGTAALAGEKGASLAAATPKRADSGPPPSAAMTPARAVEEGARAGDAAIRRAAIAACRHLGPELGAAEGLRLLGDADFGVRSAAARCLGELGSASAVEPLLQLLQRERSSAVITALGRIGQHRASQPLARILREDLEDTTAGDSSQRVEVIEALAALGDPQTRPAIARELGHPAWDVRLAAARALARLGPAAASSSEELEVCKEDFFSEVREACRDALEQAKRGLRERRRAP